MPILLDRSVCRVTELWREAWELLLISRQGRDAELREYIGAEDLKIEADRFRLVQVFRNLLENSLAATKDPVRIDITCEPASLGVAAAIRIRVNDNGPGLSTEQQKRIFEPFHTTKPTGTGLGMAIVQRLIEAHGGTIVAGNCQTAGAEFVITFPCRGVS